MKTVVVDTDEYEERFFARDSQGFEREVPFGLDDRHSYTRGFFRKHRINFGLPKEVRAYPLSDITAAPVGFKSHKLIKNFSYFVLEIPFYALPTDKYIIPSLMVEVSMLDLHDEDISGHLPSYFPTDALVNIGEVIKEIEVKGNLSLKIPQLHKIAAILGYGVGSGLDLVTGFKEWSSKTLKRIEYGLLIPKTLAGSDGICNSAWTYYQDERIGQIAQFMPILVWGVPNPILETNKNGELKIRLKLTLNNKMLPEQKVPIIFSQLINK